jgi:hypothetical protein
VWIDKADWLRIETLRKLRASGAKLVQHTTDALFPRQLGLYVTRTLIRRSVGEFDVFLTTNRRDAAKLSRRHAHVLVTQLGYDDDRFVPSANPVQDPETDCVFIGHYEPRTERYTRALAQSGLRLRVHGDAAWRTTKTAACIHAELRPPVWNSEYVEAIRSAKVALCFLSQWNYNESTARTFEIPATGTAMLAMRTAEHAAFFNEGTEALLFSNEHECIEKAKYLCANAEARCAMAQAGRARCIASGYSWKRIMERDWSRLQQRDRGLQAGSSS